LVDERGIISYTSKVLEILDGSQGKNVSTFLVVCESVPLPHLKRVTGQQKMFCGPQTKNGGR
jgi:hypothetical protein